MQEYLIVDGYNIINAWPVFEKLRVESFEHARAKLIEILSNYQGSTDSRVIIVFDAHLVKGGSQKKELIDGIEVIFSQENETADNVIEKLVGTLPIQSKITVATSDWVEQTLVLGRGAVRMSARELFLEINEVTQKAIQGQKKQVNSNTNLGLRINDRVRETLEKWRRGNI